MLNPFFSNLKEEYEARAKARRGLIPVASEALSLAKRAIFATHRNDIAGAKMLLASSREALHKASLVMSAGMHLDDEGSYRAALEEHAEAALYLQWVEKGAIAPLDGIELDAHTYLGALADVAGELQRRQVQEATVGNYVAARRAAATITEIVTAFMEMDLEGTLRTKLDQAKNALRRAEDVLYDLSLRGK